MIRIGTRTTPGMLVACIYLLMSAIPAHASEVILTAESLNATLKQIQGLQQESENAEPASRAENLYRIGVLARDLAGVLSEEVALYDSQQGGLIQLALDRTAELGIQIAWVADKNRFIHDGNEFNEYLKLMPQGEYAGESAYLLLETEFVQMAPNDPVSLLRAVEHKRDYLQRYSGHERAPEVALLLAIDYRDLWRVYRSAASLDNTIHYRELTLDQFRQVIKEYPDTRQAKVAAGLQARFQSELQQFDGDTAVGTDTDR